MYLGLITNPLSSRIRPSLVKTSLASLIPGFSPEIGCFSIPVLQWQHILVITLIYHQAYDVNIDFFKVSWHYHVIYGRNTEVSKVVLAIVLLSVLAFYGVFLAVLEILRRQPGKKHDAGFRIIL